MAAHALSAPQGATTLGASADVEPGQTKSIVSPRGDDQDGIMVTASISPRDHPRDLVLRLVALVQWGVGGTSDRVEIDIKRGFQISVPLTGLRIDVRNDAPPGDPVAHASAVVAYGTRPSSFQPTRTIELDAIDPGGSSTEVDIPSRATTVALLAIPHDYPLYSLNFREVTGGSTIYQPAPKGADDESPIANTARFVFVRNDSPNRVKPTLLFHLTV